MEKSKIKYESKHERKKKSNGLILGMCAIFVVSLVILFSVSKRLDNQNNDNLSSIQNVDDLTWKEYQELTPEEKALIPDLFEDMKAYDVWYEKIRENNETQLEITVLETEEKKAKDFTWEEYQKLTIDEKAIFPDYFDLFEEYEQWYDRTCPKE